MPIVRIAEAKPRVSVLLPFRNAAGTLDECLDSIQAQGLKDFELLAVDDGSADASAQLVARRSVRDPRLRLLQPGRVGLVGALNLGLEAARAPLVARMDADDRMHPRRLGLQVAHLDRHPGADVLGSQVRLFPEERIRAGMREYIRWQDGCRTWEDMADEIYREAPLVHPSAMFRREVIRGLGGYADGDFPEDYDLWLRCVHAGRRLAKLNEVLLDWRLRPDSHSRVDPRHSRDAFSRLRAGYLARDRRLNQGRELVFWGAGRRTRRRSDLIVRLGHPPAAYVDIDPRKLGQRIHGIPVVAPERLPRAQRPFVLCYVTNHGAPELIASGLQRMGYRRGRDYLVVG